MTPIDVGGSLLGRNVLVAHPSAELYGSDRMLLESVQAFVDAGARVTATLPTPGPLVAELLSRGAEVEICPTPVLRKGMLNPMGLIRLMQRSIGGTFFGSRLIRRTRPDIVYINTLTIPIWVVLGRFGRSRRSKRSLVVCHVHEAEAGAHKLVLRALVAPLILANQILTNSRFSRDVLGHAVKRVGARAVVIENGVTGPPAPLHARARLTTPTRLIYVGRLSPRKGVDLALDALAQLKKAGHAATLDIAGTVFPGYEWFEAAMRDRVRQLDIREQVVFHGFVESVWSLLAAADIAIVPSRYDEPFGNTAVEAVLASRPVIVSDTSGLREAAHGYEAVRLVAPGDAGAIAQAVMAIVEDWASVADGAWRDRVVATQRHSTQRYRERVVSAVCSIMASSDTNSRSTIRSFSTRIAASRQRSRDLMRARLF